MINESEHLHKQKDKALPAVGDSVDESAHFLRILAARHAFHAAGHINRVWLNDPNGLGDVFRSQAAGKNDRYAGLEASKKFPRSVLTGSAITARRVSIQQNAGGRTTCRTATVKIASHFGNASGVNDVESGYESPRRRWR